MRRISLQRICRSTLLGKLRFEPLESRRVLASISGSVVLDQNTNFNADGEDVGVRGALVWVDFNDDGNVDAGEPTAYSDSDGNYQFDDLPTGSHAVRYRPTPGLFQTSPAEQFAFQYDANTDQSSIATIDIASGQVDRIEPGALTPRGALIKTIDGTYYSTGFQNEVLYRIDPSTSQESLVGTFDLEIVAGLAYDPVMDEIYTLARETDVGVPPLRLYKINRTTAELMPVSDHVPTLDGLQFTTSMTFDSVHREIVLYDNATDRLYAYDLNGEVRALSSVAPKPFFNLSFDGHRLLSIVNNDQNQRGLYEVNRDTGTLVLISNLSENVNVNAGDLLAANHPHEVFLSSADSDLVGVDFLSGQMHLGDASLVVTPDQMTLSSENLNVSQSFDEAFIPAIDLLIDADQLYVSVSQTTSSSFLIRMGDGDQRVSVDQLHLPAIDLGGGSDTLEIAAAGTVDLTDGSVQLDGVDAIDLNEQSATQLTINPSAITQLSDSSKLRITAGAEDQINFVGSEWSVDPPTWVDGRRLHHVVADQAMVELSNENGWLNPLNRYDINRSGDVTALDALRVINLLATLDRTDLTIDNVSVWDAEYVDSSDDQIVSPLDALLVINHLAIS